MFLAGQTKGTISPWTWNFSLFYDQYSTDKIQIILIVLIRVGIDYTWLYHSSSRIIHLPQNSSPFKQHFCLLPSLSYSFTNGLMLLLANSTEGAKDRLTAVALMDNSLALEQHVGLSQQWNLWSQAPLAVGQVADVTSQLLLALPARLQLTLQSPQLLL